MPVPSPVLGFSVPDGGAWCWDACAQWWDSWCSMRGPTTRMVGGPWGCLMTGCFVPAGGGGARWQHARPGAGKPTPRAGTSAAQRGSLLPGYSVSCRCARLVGCPVPGGGDARWWDIWCWLGVPSAEEAEGRDARCLAGVPGAGMPGGGGAGGPGRGTHDGTGGSSCRRPRRSLRRDRTRCAARGAAARSGALLPVPPSAAGQDAPRGRAGGPG